MTWSPDLEIMTQRMYLIPKTYLPWISCHRTTLCLRETMIHLRNTVKKLTLSPIMADWLEKFQQLKNQFASLKSIALQFAPTGEQSQLTNKLQHLAMAVLPAPPVQWGASAQIHAGIHRHPVCSTERSWSLHNHAPWYSHICWARILQVRILHSWT